MKTGSKKRLVKPKASGLTRLRGPRLRASEVLGELKALADAKLARFQQGFFRTQPGGYGEGDVFLGIKNPDVRDVAKTHRELPLAEVAKLLGSKFHEARFCALVILMHQFDKADETGRKRIFDFYLLKKSSIDNWDLVDVSAPRIVGGFLLDKSARERRILYDLTQSKIMWHRRIAIVATHFLIRRGDVSDALKIATRLRMNEEDLMHKAVGWTLREVGKKDLSALESFLDLHAHDLPRTALRYSLERMNPSRKQHYMLAKARATE